MTTSPAPGPGTTAFIGGGNMARSLVGGLIAAGTPATAVRVADPAAAARDALAADFGVAAFDAPAEAVAGAATWVFAVKPQVMRTVCASLAAQAQAQRPLVVSIAAGITSAQLERWLGGGLPVVRAMPNTPALLGAGVTGLYANAAVDGAGRRRAETLLSTAGRTVWIDDEARMNAVTAVSGSGPAYVFLLAEAMEAAARAQGLPDEAARTLVQETLLGAARMLVESGEAPAELRRRVTSPGGTTQAAIETFESGGLRDLVGAAIANATRRGGELSAAND
jgi:pyrroline-5-carboxylate reductase